MNDNFPTSTAKGAASAYGPLLLSQPRACDAGAGTRWVSQAWTLFKARPGLWVGMGVVLFVLMMVLSMIPGLNFLLSLGFAVIVAGWVIGAYELDENQNLEFTHLFAGFQRNVGQLLLLGLLYLVGLFVCVLLGILVGAVAGGAHALTQVRWDQASGGLILAVLLGSLVVLALIVPLAMAIWFAPALVALNDMPAVDAMKLSFKACLANIVPFLLYGLVLVGLGILALLTLGLGYLVLFPMIYITYYTSYREVLTEA